MENLMELELAGRMLAGAQQKIKGNCFNDTTYIRYGMQYDFCEKDKKINKKTTTTTTKKRNLQEAREPVPRVVTAN